MIELFNVYSYIISVEETTDLSDIEEWSDTGSDITVLDQDTEDIEDILEFVDDHFSLSQVSYV